MGANGKMQYNPGWESGSMKTLAAHGLAGGIVQDRMGGSFGAGFLSGSLGSYLGSSGHSKNMFEMIGNTARDAVVGGTISVIGGGKFSNGAQTGRLGICLMRVCIMVGHLVIVVNLKPNITLQFML
ncbi:hypothetical protein BSPWISOXPB_8818 [uncultured Gammaproteobacteria bacterium]|nr:hypothetical protein BSPWISOXPB_8818 [uncultured Gammaproteobacteria bacterium]